MDIQREQLDRHRRITEQKISELEKTKSQIQKIVKETRRLPESTDRSIEKEKKKLELINILASEDSPGFKIYNEEYYELILIDEENLKVVRAFNSELGDFSINSATAGASGNMIYLDSGSSYSGLASLASSITNGRTKSELKDLLDKDDFFDIADNLKTDLKKLNPPLDHQFQEIISKYSIFEKKEESYSILLEIRSLIFDKIFKIMCPEILVCKSPWFKRGMKKHYWETKYFIQNNIPDSKVPPFLLQQIHNISLNLESNFHKLSDIGKEGHKAKDTDIVFKDTIYSFAKAISLRNSLVTIAGKGQI